MIKKYSVIRSGDELTILCLIDNHIEKQERTVLEVTTSHIVTADKKYSRIDGYECINGLEKISLKDSRTEAECCG